MDRLKKQIEFIIEIDKVKNIYRRTDLFNQKDRRENDAEHSWHISMMALILAEYSNDKAIDMLKVLKMLLIHDLVEIYAGDYFVYTEKIEEKLEKEKEGAQKIFGILPEDQKEEYLKIWHEIEEAETPEAKFATVLDRLQPILQNHINSGGTWTEYNVTAEKIINRTQNMKEGSETLWNYVEEIIKENIEKGILKEK
jgi:putative hydrolase of HD superfamily